MNNLGVNFSIPKKSNIKLKVFEVLGREITTLINKEQLQGSYKTELDGSELMSEVYFYMFQAGDFVQTKKMILMM